MKTTAEASRAGRAHEEGGHGAQLDEYAALDRGPETGASRQGCGDGAPGQGRQGGLAGGPAREAPNAGNTTPSSLDPSAPPAPERGA